MAISDHLTRVSWLAIYGTPTYLQAVVYELDEFPFGRAEMIVRPFFVFERRKIFV